MERGGITKFSFQKGGLLERRLTTRCFTRETYHHRSSVHPSLLPFLEQLLRMSSELMHLTTCLLNEFRMFFSHLIGGLSQYVWRRTKKYIDAKIFALFNTTDSYCIRRPARTIAVEVSTQTPFPPHLNSPSHPL